MNLQKTISGLLVALVFASAAWGAVNLQVGNGTIGGNITANGSDVPNLTIHGNETVTGGNIALTGNFNTGNINAALLTYNLVPTARLGSGTANATTVLYGNQTWGVISGGGGNGTPGGNTTEIQFNNAGAFGGNGNFTFNSTSKGVLIGTPTPFADVGYGGGNFTAINSMNNSAVFSSNTELTLINTALASTGTNGNVLHLHGSSNFSNAAMRFTRDDYGEMGAVGYENTGVPSQYSGKVFIASQPANNPTDGAPVPGLHTPLMLNQEETGGTAIQLDRDIEFYAFQQNSGNPAIFTLTTNASLSASHAYMVLPNYGLIIYNGTNTAGPANITLGGDANGWGIIAGGDLNNAIRIRDGGGTHNTYNQFGDTLANGGGHVFKSGGLLASQVVTFEAADDLVYAGKPMVVGTQIQAGTSNLTVNGTVSLGNATIGNITITGANATAIHITINGTPGNLTVLP